MSDAILPDDERELRIPWASPAFVAVRRLAKRHARVFIVALTALLIVGDYFSAMEIAFTLLYLVPVALGVWWRGRSFAIFIAGVCTMGAVGVETWYRLSKHRSFHIPHMVWNHGGSFLMFVAAALLLERLHEYANKEAAERRIAVEQLRQADRLGVVGKLAAGVAHELGTPLNVIVGYAELLQGEGVARPMVDKSAGIILAQAQKMSAIIRGLLDFSRPGGGERIDVDLDALAKSATAVLSPMATKKGVSIILDATESGRAIVSGNPVELEQVLVNLMVNGIHAMPEGGALRIHVSPRLLDPEAQGDTPSPQVACVEVSDEGVGIAPESLPKIFDPFFTTKEVGEGTGLGLSVSYGIVSDHGGRIRVSSTLGGGSRFCVFLPLAERPPESLGA